MPSILIVDDEPNIRRVLAAMLKRDGYEVTTAADGEQALAVLARLSGSYGFSGVVITDMKMPVMDGIQL